MRFKVVKFNHFKELSKIEGDLEGKSEEIIMSNF